MVGTPEVVVVPNEEKGQEDTTTVSNPEEDPDIGSLYSHSPDEPTLAIATTQGQEAYMQTQKCWPSYLLTWE